MTPLKLAILDLSRKVISTLIAIFSIALAVACAGVLIKLFFLSQSRFDTLANEGQAIVGAKSGAIEILLGAENLEGEFPDFVPYRLFQSIHAKQKVHFEDGKDTDASGIDAVIPILYFADCNGFRVIGTSPDFIHRPVAQDSPVLESGRWVNDGEHEVVVGSEVARKLNYKVDSTAPVYVVGKNPLMDMKVVGVLRPTGKIWDYALYSSLKAGQTIIASSPISLKTIWGPEVLHYFIVYMQPSAYAPLKSLINERTVAQAVFVPEAKDKLEALSGTGRDFGLMLMALVLFLGGSSVATLMITRFEAMSVQIAVLRALGYSRGELTSWLLWEGILLGISACIAGGLIDGAIFPAIRHAAHLDLTVVHGNFFAQTILVWLAALSATILAVSVPLVRLAKQNIHTALRG